MILYHITYETDQDEEYTFMPRVPEGKIEKDENTTISRVCFADSIQNCIRAINGYPRDEINYIRVYEFEVESNDINLLTWKELYSNGYVNDAELTHEFWYLKPVTLKSRVYRIKRFDVQKFIVVAHNAKKRIVDVLINQLHMDQEAFREMSASYILNDWLKEKSPDTKQVIFDALRHEEECTEEVNAELHYQIFGEYPITKTNIVNEYYEVAMVDNIEIIEVNPDSEFLIKKCLYYELQKYISEYKFELCWQILDEGYVWNKGGYLYKVVNLSGKLIGLIYCSECNELYRIEKYEILSQYRNKGYGGQIIEAFFEKEGIEKESVVLIPESEEAARFWHAHGINRFV